MDYVGRLEELADELNEDNYHAESGFIYSLIRQLKEMDGLENNDLALALVEFVIDYDWRYA